MGISLRAYAKARGCSLTAVQKAIATKRITRLPDGSIDAERANREWLKNTFAGQTVREAAAPERLPSAHESPAPTGDPVTQLRAARDLALGARPKPKTLGKETNPSLRR